MYDGVAELFAIPEIAVPYIDKFLRKDECTMINVMGNRSYTYDDLCYKLADYSVNPSLLINEAYSRGVLNKQVGTNCYYVVADFYTRLAYFTQYESDIWSSISEADRKKIDEWYIKQYARNAYPRLTAALAGKGLIENAYFITLDEAIALIDSLKCDLYMVPCNCKSVALNCSKPRNVCILFNKGNNSEWDRGHGKGLSKDDAKAIVVNADKHGLMHTSETATAICNCCGDCCYPIRASKMLGTQGIWPKKRYKIVWDSDRCISCRRCVKICNFNAFKQKGKTVYFEEKECWGCTICKKHCPTGAISIEKI